MPAKTTTQLKPIIFSTPMVKAILEGKKTQTRRIIIPQPHAGIRRCPFVPSRYEDGHGREIKVKYRMDDILYVRETWFYDKTDKKCYYRAGAEKYEDYDPTEWKWKPSIYMPKKYARLFMVIQNVKLQKLQDITPSEVRAEGIIEEEGDGLILRDKLEAQRFEDLWDSLNAKRGYLWESNPWVWAIEFERVPYDNEGLMY